MFFIVNMYDRHIAKFLCTLVNSLIDHNKLLATSCVIRVLEYSINSSTEYSNSKMFDSHSPSDKR